MQDNAVSLLKYPRGCLTKRKMTEQRGQNTRKDLMNKFWNVNKMSSSHLGTIEFKKLENHEFAIAV